MSNYTAPIGSDSQAEGAVPRPGAGPEVGFPAPPPKAGVNVMAILALILAFVFAPLGIVFGVIARKQVRRTGETGKGLATAGVVLGIVFTAIGLTAIALVVFVFATIVPSVSHTTVAAQISDQVNTSLGHRPDSVSCPSDLPATVGASVRCTVTDAGQNYAATATVTSVNGGTANYSVVLG